MLSIYPSVPDGLLDLDTAQLAEALKGPTLLELKGRRPEPLFVSIIQHGNEPTGWLAARELLRRYQSQELPRALTLFIANVDAAAKGQRHLPEQPDFNRCWPGGDAGHYRDHPVTHMLSALTQRMRRARPFASIDLHNTTGLNPHYGAVNRLTPEFLHLACLFSRTVVYFTQPTGVQASAFAEICPSITVECGSPGTPRGTQHALELLDSALRLRRLPNQPLTASDVDLFHTVATVRVPARRSFAFGHRGADIAFVNDLDQLNFQELPVGTCMAYSDRPDRGLEVWDNRGQECSTEFFAWEQGEVRTRRTVMPSMLTRDPEIIRQDVLCYLMERFPLAPRKENASATGVTLASQVTG